MLPTKRSVIISVIISFMSKQKKLYLNNQCSCFQNVYFGIPVNNETELISDLLGNPWKK